MSKNYTGNLADGREIYIPKWSVSVQFENLTQVCKYLGQSNVIDISELNVPAAMIAIMNAEDAVATTKLILHFTQQARIAGEKVTLANMDELGMATVVELFTHVIHSQFNNFFVSGLAKVPSLNS